MARGVGPDTPAHVSKRNRAIIQIANAFLHAAIGRLAGVQPQQRQIACGHAKR
jgi:hypothetical protein